MSNSNSVDDGVQQNTLQVNNKEPTIIEQIIAKTVSDDRVTKIISKNGIDLIQDLLSSNEKITPDEIIAAANLEQVTNENS